MDLTTFFLYRLNMFLSWVLCQFAMFVLHELQTYVMDVMDVVDVMDVMDVIFLLLNFWLLCATVLSITSQWNLFSWEHFTVEFSMYYVEILILAKILAWPPR